MVMNKKELNELMPRNKDDQDRAKQIVSLGYPAVKPVVNEMLRWLRTYESPVANVFLSFFSEKGMLIAEEVNQALESSKQDHLKYVIVTKVLPQWHRDGIERLVHPLNMLVTQSGEPETALTSIKLLAKYDLNKKEWLKGWLEFITERLERNLADAREIRSQYF